MPTGISHFVYDEGGKLLGEYDRSGNPIQEFVYLGDLPVAVIAGVGAASEVLNVWPDHLGTPRMLTDQAGRSRWRWDSLPFGESGAWEDPSGVGAVRFNLRFPGQYFERETGLHYNYFRDYDPHWRQTTSDPIGLEGGINTYAYVGGNPVSLSDPSGLVAGAAGGAALGGALFCLRNPAICSAAAAATGAAIAEALGLGKKDSTASCPDDTACDPPEGTKCYEGPDVGKPHAGLSPHYHIFQMHGVEPPTVQFANGNISVGRWVSE